MLAFGFFARLFDDELPFEIRFFVSFVIMVNAGYFTLMFLVSLLRAPNYLVKCFRYKTVNKWLPRQQPVK